MKNSIVRVYFRKHHAVVFRYHTHQYHHTTIPMHVSVNSSPSSLDRFMLVVRSLFTFVCPIHKPSIEAGHSLPWNVKLKQDGSSEDGPAVACEAPDDNPPDGFR